MHKNLMLTFWPQSKYYAMKYQYGIRAENERFRKIAVKQEEKTWTLLALFLRRETGQRDKIRQDKGGQIHPGDMLKADIG